MAQERAPIHRASDAVATTTAANRSTTAPHLSAAMPVERRTHTDARTHATSIYERDGRGREVYATYYNSNEDPTFQARYNTAGNGAYVHSSAFTFVSHGGAQTPQRGPTATVEEVEAEPSVEARRSHRTRTMPTAQPIIEEPDDDDEEDNRYGDVEHRQRRAHRDDGHRPLSHTLHRQHQLQRTSAQPHRDDASRAYQLSPFAPQRAMMMHDFMNDDSFFAGPRNPFGMMDAMRHHMSQQRAAMFGGVDPFANFF